MQGLQALIIERIVTARRIERDREAIVREALPIVGVEAEFRVNRAVIKFLSGLRKKERERAGE